MALRTAPSLLAITGYIVVVGFEPDGDTIHFRPSDAGVVAELRDADRVTDPASVSLRLEGIDAPETHFRATGGGALVRQPLAAPARDALLADAGFTRVHRDGERVTSATPEHVPAVVLSTHADRYGRIVSFVLAGPESGELPTQDGWIPVPDELLERTLNAAQLRQGGSYLTLYTSAAPAHRRTLRRLAVAARRSRRGVWSEDRTRSFELVDQASIGPNGELILPKLFRRCTDFLAQRRPGDTLPSWLRDRASADDAQQDLVVVDGRHRVPLHALLQERRSQVVLTADPVDLVFVDAG